jgi:arylsulfatase A-like enzyme
VGGAERELLPLAAGPLALAPAPRPNLLVVVADDLGWADLSCYGSSAIRTPNLDGLAASGVRFTQGYAASPICSPTRFALYTGRYPGRLQGGLKEPISGANDVDGIPTGHPTLASLLKEEGYETALIGKWHCGHLPWFSPTRLGWDEFLGNFAGAIDYFSKLDSRGNYDLYQGEVEHEDQRYYTDVITEAAVGFVRREHAGPWLLNLNYTAPHWPWEGPGDRAVSDEISARIRAGDGAAIFHGDGGSAEKYREMVESLDAGVGEVLAALRDSGALDDTLVLFFSDNGGDDRFADRAPFTGEKGRVLEGGIRVSTMVSWPGAVSGGRVSDERVVTMDWTATLLELGGADPAAGYPLDGTTLVDHLVDGAPLPERDLFWRMRDERALRRGDLKYVRLADGADRLYDLAEDLAEQADAAERRPGELGDMRAAWERIDSTLLPY